MNITEAAELMAKTVGEHPGGFRTTALFLKRAGVVDPDEPVTPDDVVTLLLGHYAGRVPCEVPAAAEYLGSQPAIRMGMHDGQKARYLPVEELPFGADCAPVVYANNSLRNLLVEMIEGGMADQPSDCIWLRVNRGLENQRAVVGFMIDDHSACLEYGDIVTPVPAKTDSTDLSYTVLHVLHRAFHPRPSGGYPAQYPTQEAA